jgi:transposase
MIHLSGKHVYLINGSTDMRKGIDALSALVSHHHHSSYSGAIYIFCNIISNRIKLLEWDGKGYCLYYKRLPRGLSFTWPNNNGMVVQITTNDMNLLLRDVIHVDPRNRW